MTGPPEHLQRKGMAQNGEALRAGESGPGHEYDKGQATLASPPDDPAGDLPAAVAREVHRARLEATRAIPRRDARPQWGRRGVKAAALDRQGAGEAAPPEHLPPERPVRRDLIGADAEHAGGGCGARRGRMRSTPGADAEHAGGGCGARRCRRGRSRSTDPHSHDGSGTAPPRGACSDWAGLPGRACSRRGSRATSLGQSWPSRNMQMSG
jgi:hypothetical protein